MPAYVIVETTVTNDAWIAEYRANVTEFIEKHGGKSISRGAPVARLEGDRELPDVVVIFEFPTLEQARAWYDDPGYEPFIKLRQTGAHSEMTLVEGM